MQLRLRLQSVMLILILLLCLASCARNRVVVVDTLNLAQLQGATADFTDAGEFGKEIGQLRYKALEDTALSLGAQAGLAFASQEINENLEKDKKYLETLFNFNGMMLSHGVLPPVLVQGDNTLNLADPDTIRIADKNYKIVKQARFATTPPNWREYLMQLYPKPELPDKSLLPRNSAERKGWANAIKRGWQLGTEQAYNIFQQNIARLKRDYQGMILYRKLLEERMITPPYVARTELGVTGTGDDMRINDQVLRITEHPQLQTDTKNWKPVVVQHDV